MVTVAFFTSPSIYPSRAAAAATSEIEFASSLATSREKWSEASTAAGCRHWRSHSVRRRGVWAYIENEGGQPTVSFRSYLDSACLRLAGLVAQHLAAFLNVTVHFRLCRTSHLMHCKFIHLLPYLELRKLSFCKLRGSCFWTMFRFILKSLHDNRSYNLNVYIQSPFIGSKPNNWKSQPYMGGAYLDILHVKHIANEIIILRYLLYRNLGSLRINFNDFYYLTWNFLLYRDIKVYID
jgi:hypothetical protein